MSEPGSRRGRPHDAEGAREAILNAAEDVFAEHGFDGARIDAIAAEAGYNKSLIFQYYGDKLNLYAEVLKRADKGTSEIQERALAPLLEDETATLTAHRFKAILEAAIQTLFDYLLEHPRFRRIILWEMAEGWQTYAKVASQFTTEDVEQFRMLFNKAHSAGLLRSDLDPVVQFSIVLQMCISHLSFIPMYETMLPEQDFASHAALMRARDYIVAFVVAGMMVDPEEARQ